MNHRQIFAERYAIGSGVEVGALFFPWPIPRSSKVKYIDKYPMSVLRQQYPEHADKTFVETDIIDDGMTLSKVPTDSQDFVITSHVLEHAPDVIATLETWLRVVRKGGHVMMAIPELSQTFDRERAPTEIEHFFEEFKNEKKLEQNYRWHYEEFLSKVDKLEGAPLVAAVDKLMISRMHIHFHCWTQATMKVFFDEVFNRFYGLEVKEFVQVNHEVFVVLKKTVPGEMGWLPQ